MDESNEAAVQKANDSIRMADFDQHRGLLFSIAYRMLGSVADAEDMLQETFLRWRQAADEEIRSPRSYLVTIVSRMCINHLQLARVQREEYVGQWLPEPLVVSPAEDPLSILKTDESLSMAFLVLLERLTPIERAVFLLREVFEYEYAEISAILGQNEANCRQILHRARRHVSTMRPRFTVSEGQQGALVKRFREAVETGDAASLAALLASDVELHADGGGRGAAVPNVIYGSDKVTRGILGAFARYSPAGVERRYAQVNGSPGIVSYVDGMPHSVLTLAIRENRIHALYIVTNPDKLAHICHLA